MDFDCNGTELNLGDCKHQMNAGTCGVESLAGFTCILKKIELRDGLNEFEGKLFVGGLPVCGHSWKYHMDFDWVWDKSRQYATTICKNLVDKPVYLHFFHRFTKMHINISQMISEGL